MSKIQEMTMKKLAIAGLLALVTATAATSAFAGQQTTAAAMDNQLNWQMARDFGRAHASVNAPTRVRRHTAADERAVDFQAVGSY
jgi:hypothetical protein